MKKLLSIIGAGALITTSATSVVACGVKKYTDIFLVSDVGKINDKSFNESAYNGSNKFIKEQLNIEDMVISHLTPQNTSEIERNYDSARKNGAKALVLPGFAHQEHINHASEVMADSGEGSVVFLDGDNKGNKNVIGIQFKSEMSGFYSGVASILYKVSVSDKPAEVKLSAFGGLHNATGVTNFISGFMASIDFMNSLKKESPDVLTSLIKVLNKDKSESDFIGASRVATQMNAPASDKDQNWFSGSFEVGGGTTTAEKLISENADVIFPVAGPQTEDTLAAIKKSNRKDSIHIVGVDTDQVQLYKNYSDYFITSATKKLEESTQSALVNSKVYADKVTKEQKDEFIGKDKSGNKIEGSWDGQNVWFDGDFSSGGSNKISDQNYKDLIAILSPAGLALSVYYQENISTKVGAKEILNTEAIKSMGEIAAKELKSNNS
ncbi:BMP family ABC transporter substrate-binding protein [Spiroplasma alleghenense]|uniref:Basic membrane protein A n=1 Tax=Spiroplasma alleghenense TaxID=216931 RepID=A0A345Z2D1_9MOLU|nr:BMP family ABC transporter substrate-binding protein [Spiroplasma alleghenense]AXK50760.1 basic membrane protein A [Spiroplasma alleghenense]